MANHLQLIDNLLNIIAISASGSDHSLFLNNEGKVYCCGNNDAGQLGLGHYTMRNNTLQLIVLIL